MKMATIFLAATALLWPYEFTVPSEADFNLCLQQNSSSVSMDTARIVSWFQAASGQRPVSSDELKTLRAPSTTTLIQNQLIEFEDAMRSLPENNSTLKQSCTTFSENLIYSFDHFKRRLKEVIMLGTPVSNNEFRVSARTANAYDRLSDPKHVITTLTRGTYVRRVETMRDANGIEWVKVVFSDPQTRTVRLGWMRRDELAIR